MNRSLRSHVAHCGAQRSLLWAVLASAACVAVPARAQEGVPTPTQTAPTEPTAPTPPTTPQASQAAPSPPVVALPNSEPASNTPPQSLWTLSQTKPGPTKAVAPAPEPPAEIPATLDNLGNFQSHWQLFVHVRGSWVSDPALDPFADSDFISAVGIGAARTVFSQGQWSVAVTALGEAGSTKSSVRGSSSELDLSRLEVGPELRLHWVPRSYVFLRALPGVLSAHASLDDVTVGGALEDTQVSFAADLGAGIAVNLGGSNSGEGHPVRFWLSAEGGYGVAFVNDFSLKPKDASAAPARAQLEQLAAPSLNAPLMRLSLSVTF